MFSIAVSVGMRLYVWKMKTDLVPPRLRELLLVQRRQVDVAENT